MKNAGRTVKKFTVLIIATITTIAFVSVVSAEVEPPMIEEVHLLCTGTQGNVYLEGPLKGVYDYYGDVLVTFNYEDSTTATVSATIPWGWLSGTDWADTYSYRTYVGLNPGYMYVGNPSTMYEVKYVNPQPTKGVESITVGDDWISWYPWSDVFAVTVKTSERLPPSIWYTDGTGYYFLEKDDRTYFDEYSSAYDVFSEYSTYNGIKFLIGGDNDHITDIGRFNLTYDSTVTIPTYTVTAITATVDIDPDTLNLQSKGKWITCYIELPEGYDVNDVDVDTILLNGAVAAELKPTCVGDYDSDGILDLMIKFDRSNVQDLLSPTDATQLTVMGEVAGIPFKGSDTIRVISKGDG